LTVALKRKIYKQIQINNSIVVVLKTNINFSNIYKAASRILNAFYKTLKKININNIL